MNTLELNILGRANIKNFLGVFAADQKPSIKSRPPFNFISNTQTKNLPGQHWVGVSVDWTRSAHIFDPLGFPPSRLLVKNLRDMGVKNITYNSQQIQNVYDINCGELVLQHLMHK